MYRKVALLLVTAAVLLPVGPARPDSVSEADVIILGGLADPFVCQSNLSQRCFAVPDGATGWLLDCTPNAPGVVPVTSPVGSNVVVYGDLGVVYQPFTLLWLYGPTTQDNSPACAPA